MRRHALLALAFVLLAAGVLLATDADRQAIYTVLRTGLTDWLSLREQSSAPSNPPSGRYRLYVDSTGTLQLLAPDGSTQDLDPTAIRETLTLHAADATGVSLASDGAGVLKAMDGNGTLAPLDVGGQIAFVSTSASGACLSWDGISLHAQNGSKTSAVPFSAKNVAFYGSVLVYSGGIIVPAADSNDVGITRGGTKTIRLCEGTSGTGLAALQATRPVEAHTADDALAETESGGLHTNRGAAATVPLTLPTPPETGTTFAFSRVAAFALRVDPAATENLHYSGGAMDAGEYLELASDGASITLTWDGSEWVSTSEQGTLAEEAP